jgi:hypothetical protein
MEQNQIDESIACHDSFLTDIDVNDKLQSIIFDLVEKTLDGGSNSNCIQFLKIFEQKDHYQSICQLMVNSLWFLGTQVNWNYFFRFLFKVLSL